MDQYQTTIQHIELYIKKVRIAEDNDSKYRYINKTVGALSLAKQLDIITIDEYEHYFKELYK